MADFILDNVADHSVSEYKNALRPKGVFVIVGGSMRLIFSLMLFGKIYSKKGGRKLGVLIHKPDRNDLNKLNEFFEAGKLTPVIDKVFPLNKTAEAVQYLGEGHVKGKVIVSIEEGL